MLNETSERRRFFRINDSVSLSYRLIDAATANMGLKATDIVNSEFSLAATLELLSQDALRMMQHLQAQNPQFLDLYRVLDAKINAIAQAMMFLDRNVNAKSCQNVSLSAAGLAFQQQDVLEVGQNLAIQLYLPGALAQICVYARVVNCKPVDAGNDQMIGVDFTHVREEDQELLIKHVVRTQWQQLRESKAMAQF
jgi:Tfp pilus assembly protein PilZ